MSLVFRLVIWLVLLSPILAFADSDPFAQTGMGISNILFGTFGMTICTITIGGTFIMAKFGKVSWDRFITVAFCVAGFLGAPSIVMMIKSWL